jgi:hypothetical protein
MRLLKGSAADSEVGDGGHGIVIGWSANRKLSRNGFEGVGRISSDESVCVDRFQTLPDQGNWLFI